MNPKKLIKAVMGVGFIAFVFIGIFVPQSGCACITPEMTARVGVSTVDKIVNEYKSEHGKYPQLEILQQELDNYLTENPRALMPRTSYLSWDENREYGKIYYRQLGSGQDYELVSYVEQETLFGRTVVKKISP